MSNLEKYAKLQYLKRKLNTYKNSIKNIKENVITCEDIFSLKYQFNYCNVPAEINQIITENMKFDLNENWCEISNLYKMSVYSVFSQWINSQYPFLENVKPINNAIFKKNGQTDFKSQACLKSTQMFPDILSGGRDHKIIVNGMETHKQAYEEFLLGDYKDMCANYGHDSSSHNASEGDLNIGASRKHAKKIDGYIFDENLKGHEIARIKELLATKADWIEISKDLRKPPFVLFKGYKKALIGKPSKWSTEEDLKLLDAVKKLGHGKWANICNVVGRTPQQCLHRYKKISTRRGRWSKCEDERLLAAVEMFGFKWSKVAECVGKRSDAQCRDRYRNILDPCIKHDSFSDAEISMIEDLVKIHGKRWSKIAEIIKNRSDSQIRRAYKKNFEDEKK